MPDLPLKKVCLHPYYAASLSNLTDVFNGTMGKLAPVSLGAKYCPTKGVDGCIRRHPAMDLNTPGMIENAPYSALRAPFAGTIIACGTSASGNRFITIESNSEMALSNGTFAKCRVSYVHLGICNQRTVTGVEGLRTTPKLIGFPRSTTPSAWFLTWSRKNAVFNYVWVNQINSITRAQRSIELGNVRPGDRLESWFTEGDTLDGFPIPTFTRPDQPSMRSLSGVQLVFVDDWAVTQMGGLAATLASEAAVYYTATKTMTAAGILRPAIAVGLAGGAAAFVGSTALWASLSPSSVSRYQGTMERSAQYGSFMIFGFKPGDYVQRGMLLGFAGNTGTVSTRRTGATAGRHLHLITDVRRNNSWQNTNPNTFYWRI
jgi:hypothetical protein